MSPTAELLRERFPKASQDFLEANAGAVALVTAAVPQHAEEHRPPVPKLKLGRKMNQTEQEFQMMLLARVRAGEFAKVDFEGVKLKVGDGTYYTPDFCCEPVLPENPIPLAEFDRRVVFFEIKGKQKWDDAIVKFKAARERYVYWARFEMWDKVPGEGWRQLA